MANLEKILKDEIRRIARIESKNTLIQVKKENLRLRKQVADLKRQIAGLERKSKTISRVLPKPVASKVVADDKVKNARITGKMIKAVRKKLKLSQAEFAALVGVSVPSVCLWEKKDGRITFRGNSKAAVVEVRTLGLKEAKQRLEELGAKVRTAKASAKAKAKKVAAKRGRKPGRPAAKKTTVKKITKKKVGRPAKKATAKVGRPAGKTAKKVTKKRVKKATRK